MLDSFLQVVTAQTDKLLLGCFVLLVILSALQLRRLKKTNKQFEYLTDKLTGYLKAVLTEDELTEETPVVSRQEKNMRESIEKQRQTNAKDAQVIDAVLSEIFP
ncbi:MAG: hypothetical protein PUD20_00940 [bacterium]|nr:hypothetical protein [bacterium]